MTLYNIPNYLHNVNCPQQISVQFNYYIKENMFYKEKITEILPLLPKKGIIAIDGYAAAGKSTFATELAERIGAVVIKIDDYFLPVNERKDLIVGHIDKLRFFEEVINGIESKKDFYTRAFDCKKQELKAPVLHKKSDIYIFEGTYSMEPEINYYVNCGIFMTVNRDIQQERILNRNGKEGLKAFNELWIPKEVEYFVEYEIRSECKIII